MIHEKNPDRYEDDVFSIHLLAEIGDLFVVYIISDLL